ncbi:hypothetical protein GC167_06750 [bacterium]|nr:hypothetical protein [bacterium]
MTNRIWSGFWALCASLGGGWAQTWTALPDFPGSKRDDGVAFVLGGKAYCGTGLNEEFAETGDFFSFEPVLNAWEPALGLPEGAERQYACAWV